MVNEDYMNRYNFIISANEDIITKDETLKRWRWISPNFCAYEETDISWLKAMHYHSDYIQEPITSPGYKFVYTSLAYFNDNYKGGEIDFCIGKKLVEFKPEAGDILVFPSGHPNYFTENGQVYLHAVNKVIENKKYFCRSYWMEYNEGSVEWHEKEKEFGKEKWWSMQNEIVNKYRKDHPQRSFIEDGIRIK